MSEGFEKLSVPIKLLSAGSAACFADFISFPLDTAKVRLQVSNSFETIKIRNYKHILLHLHIQLTHGSIYNLRSVF
jgi:organic hydroperoxide reductase OsmC/OhrA